jgi:hypothetical protein
MQPINLCFCEVFCSSDMLGSKRGIIHLENETHLLCKRLNSARDLALGQVPSVKSRPSQATGSPRSIDGANLLKQNKDLELSEIQSKAFQYRRSSKFKFFFFALLVVLLNSALMQCTTAKGARY